MTEITWIKAALAAARPRAVGALLRYFRDLDTAEEAFQDACLRALKTWPVKGPPRDPAACSGACTLASSVITASSCAWLQEKTASSLL